MLSPNSVWEWILTFLLFAISLAVLIIIHELGHFSMAKAFNVYCQEFSLGFGPAIFSKKGKGKETYFSLRAIPFGGYVSMYGEGEENPVSEDGTLIPKERSLEGIVRWKKAIILVAGIVMNIILALTLFAISNIAFPVQKASSQIKVAENSIAMSAGLKDYDKISFYIPDECTSNAIYVGFDESTSTYKKCFYIIDNDIEIDGNHYFLTYLPQGAKNDTNLSSVLSLYPSENSSFSSYESDVTKKITLLNYDGEIPSSYMPNSHVCLDIKLNYYSYLGEVDDEKTYDTNLTSVTLALENLIKEGTVDTYIWNDVGIDMRVVQHWLPFNERIQNTFIDFGSSSVAVFKGLASLFTGGIKNMSGVVGIMTTSASIYSSYTFSTYLYFWGLISVNLAIFNLLPFPGLDGWQLLVTVVEGGTNKVLKTRRKHQIESNKISSDNEYVEWKIPSKVKTIVSYIGLGILFLFMIAIVVMDVLRLVGVI